MVTCAFLCNMLFYSITSNTVELRSMYVADLRTGEFNGDDTACARVPGHVSPRGNTYLGVPGCFIVKQARFPRMYCPLSLVTYSVLRTMRQNSVCALPAGLRLPRSEGEGGWDSATQRLFLQTAGPGAAGAAEAPIRAAQGTGPPPSARRRSRPRPPLPGRPPPLPPSFPAPPSGVSDRTRQVAGQILGGAEPASWRPRVETRPRACPSPGSPAPPAPPDLPTARAQPTRVGLPRRPPRAAQLPNYENRKARLRALRQGRARLRQCDALRFWREKRCIRIPAVVGRGRPGEKGGGWGRQGVCRGVSGSA